MKLCLYLISYYRYFQYAYLINLTINLIYAVVTFLQAMQMVSTTESRPFNYLFFAKEPSLGRGRGAVSYIFLHFNINAFHVYIFPVTSVWITLQRDDISRQGKPATLSRQSINQRKIIRNISQATAPGYICLRAGWSMEHGEQRVGNVEWRTRMRNWRWKNERLQRFGSQINTKHQTTDRVS